MSELPPRLIPCLGNRGVTIPEWEKPTIGSG